MRFLGLIGYPLKYSFSKKFFSEYFKKEKIEAQYELYPLEDISKFPTLISAKDISGLNVTIPYKEQILPYLDEIDSTAAEIGAVNVIQFYRENGKRKTKGFNTDTIGFEKSLKPFLKENHKNALVLGTGGAAKAITYTLLKNGIQAQYVSRKPSHSAIGYSDLNKEILEKNLIIINCTPLGMEPDVNACPDIPYQYISNKHLVYDVIYIPEETLFLKKCRERGATTKNGLEMLYIQAEESAKIFEI